MDAFRRTMSRRVTCCAAVVGAAGLVSWTLAGTAGPDRAGAGAALASTADVFAGAICHAPVTASRGYLQFAQTEVSPMGRRAADPAAAFADSDPPLWQGLGTLSYRITTARPEAQAYFDQGLRLAYGFNHAEAQRAFRKAQRLDPACALCFWGEALVLGPNINMPMMAEAAAPAYAAVSRARALADKASPRERALIEALSARYAENAPADRAALDRAYADAMTKVAAQFPDDNEIMTLYAEALMDLSPWDYWERGGTEPKPQSREIVPTLERVLARAPDHMGAIHLYIHAVEASDRPERAEPYADRLRGATPGAGHLVHMPSHVYYRIGRYADALAVNKDAVAADERYLGATGAPPGVYRLGYYPHNVHFVLATAQMSGDAPTVLAAAEKLRGLIPDEAAKGIALVQPVKAAPYFAHAQFSPPETVLALPDPGAAIPYVKAMWHYARGVAFVAQGRLSEAKAEADAIAALDRSADFSLLADAGIPANDVLKIAQHVIQGRIFQADGKYPFAVVEFEKAAALQDGLAYMEPPYWYYPVRQSLGAALIQVGRLDDAEVQFRRSLRRAPNNAWSHYGLVELYKARGDAVAHREAEQVLGRTWVGDRRLLHLSNL